MITVTIDGNRIETAEGMTILEAARENGISIPTLCYLKGLMILAPAESAWWRLRGMTIFLHPARQKCRRIW